MVDASAVLSVVGIVILGVILYYLWKKFGKCFTGGSAGLGTCMGDAAKEAFNGAAAAALSFLGIKPTKTNIEILKDTAEASAAAFALSKTGLVQKAVQAGKDARAASKAAGETDEAVSNKAGSDAAADTMAKGSKDLGSLKNKADIDAAEAEEAAAKQASDDAAKTALKEGATAAEKKAAEDAAATLAEKTAAKAAVNSAEAGAEAGGEAAAEAGAEAGAALAGEGILATGGALLAPLAIALVAAGVIVAIEKLETLWKFCPCDHPSLEHVAGAPYCYKGTCEQEFGTGYVKSGLGCAIDCKAKYGSGFYDAGLSCYRTWPPKSHENKFRSRSVKTALTSAAKCT